MSIRLIGALNVENGIEDLKNYKAIGFDVAVIRQDNSMVWSNVDEDGNGAFIYDVYTSFLAAGETVQASTCGGDYVFMYALDGIPADKGVITLSIKTFYVDANGAKTYTDMAIVDYNINQAA